MIYIRNLQDIYKALLSLAQLLMPWKFIFETQAFIGPKG